jgi:predicted transcriptional regulator
LKKRVIDMEIEKLVEKVRKRSPYDIEDAILNKVGLTAKETWNECCDMFLSIARESPSPSEIIIDKSERGKIRIMMDIINNISKTKKEIPIEEIKENGMKEGLSEKEILDIIDKLKREGMLFEMIPDHVQRV